jgi:hypothetical protein
MISSMTDSEETLGNDATLLAYIDPFGKRGWKMITQTTLAMIAIVAAIGIIGIVVVEPL